MMSSPERVDPLELEIFRHAIESLVEELEINITRTAHSQIVYEYKDYAVGLLTRDFRLFGQSLHNLPIFLANLAEPVRDAVSVIGEDRLEPGDVFVSNYAPAIGQHLNNVLAAAPIHVDGTIVGYCAVLMHWSDIGGVAPTSTSWNARSIFQEGTQYRGIKVMSGGSFVPENIATIRANSYQPDTLIADVYAHAGACALGVRRWGERIATKWSPEHVSELVAAQTAASAQLARARVAAIPDGRYEATAFADDEGIPGTPPLPLSVTMIVEGDKMIADLSGMPPQTEAPINSGRFGGALAAVRVAFKSLIAPERGADEGFFEPLELVIPPGTVLSATGEAPMGFWHQTIGTTIDLVFKAIGSELPALVPAGHHANFAGLTFIGRRDDGAVWNAQVTVGGGFGASKDRDGFGPLKTLGHGDNTDIPVELIEGRFPLRVRSHRFWHEAAGDGLHRGGPGAEKIIEVTEPCQALTMQSRTVDPPWGLAGGEAALPGSIDILYPDTTEWISTPRSSGIALAAGTLIRLRAAGGGGWGTPPSKTVDANATEGQR